jgi:hypothetical protein
VEGKTFESLDQLVEILGKFNKNPHIKASWKASPVTPSMALKTKTTPVAPTQAPTTPAPAPTVKMLNDICKVTKKHKCTACGGDHFINKCEFLAQLGYTITFVNPNPCNPPALELTNAVHAAALHLTPQEDQAHMPMSTSDTVVNTIP